jgi:UTP-glucose-1-phosphate uridylyltransferase/mevalonate kinase
MNNEYVEIFVPGRLCLFGEHSDWAGGYRRVNADIQPGMAIVTGIEQGIKARVSKARTLQISSFLPDGSRTDVFDVPMDVKLLKAMAVEGGFFSYCAGVAAYLLEHYRIGGISIDCYEMTLPMKKGLSSSAAICVLIARAFNKLYNLQLNVKGEMEIAYRGEILTPSRCGRMDQACAYGQRPVLMIFDGDSIEIEKIKVSKPMYWVFADLKTGKNTKKILSDLNKCYPFPQNEKDREVQDALGTLNKKIVQDVVKALEMGEPIRVGELMNEAQKIFDKMVMPASPTELASPKLHSVLGDEQVKKLVWGGKGVGSQGDGTVQFIARGKNEQKKLLEYLSNEYKLDAYPFEIKAHQSVQKAVVPLAGYGTRLFPASKIVKKEFFPIVDWDGIAKPALLLLLEELDKAGIEQICLIIAEGEEEIYKGLFEFEPNDEYIQKLSSFMREYDQRIRRIGPKITYVYQKERLGFGHAVYQSKEFANNEPVLLVLGDHIFRSKEEQCCAAQAIDAYESNNGLTVLVQEIPLDQVSNYGIISGNWMDEDERCLSVNEIYEKPTVEYAKENLGVKMKNGVIKYFSVFGQYILTTDVYEALEQNISERRIEKGEYQLTSALETVRKEKGMFAFKPNGERFDIGIPHAYRNTIWNYLE